MNTNEIPAELWRKNMISWHEWWLHNNGEIDILFEKKV